MSKQEIVERLEATRIDLPIDFENRIFAVAGRIPVAEGFAINLTKIQDTAEEMGATLNAMHVVSMLIVTWLKMFELGSPKAEILAVLNNMPRYLADVLSDKSVLQDAIHYMDIKTSDFRFRLNR